MTVQRRTSQTPPRSFNGEHEFRSVLCLFGAIVRDITNTLVLNDIQGSMLRRSFLFQNWSFGHLSCPPPMKGNKRSDLPTRIISQETHPQIQKPCILRPRRMSPPPSARNEPSALISSFNRHPQHCRRSKEPSRRLHLLPPVPPK